MERTMIRELEGKVGEKVVLQGWIFKIRKLKSVTFIVLRDRSGYVQLVLEPEQFPNIRLESVIQVEGVIGEGHNKYGHVEIVVSGMQILSEAMGELPLSINNETLDVGIEVNLNNRVLSLRHKHNRAVFKIQSGIAKAFGEFLSSHEFTEIHTPKIVKEGAEGGSNVFCLDYFGEKAFLAQSPQFYKQMMVIAGMERVYEIGPVFRAESHNTSRHLNEYISLDLEMGFIFQEETLMTLETQLLQFMMTDLATHYQAELDVLDVILPKVPALIPRLKLSEAIEILKGEYGRTHLEGDLDPEGEVQICDYMFQKTGSEFLFLTDYPQAKRPMYAMPAEGGGTRSFDLLFRGIEITTGGLRIHDYNRLVSNMKAKGLDPEKYGSYLEAFKYGAPPHGGLAIGLERLCAKLLGFSNVRQTSLFPRDMGRLLP